MPIPPLFSLLVENRVVKMANFALTLVTVVFQCITQPIAVAASENPHHSYSRHLQRSYFDESNQKIALRMPKTKQRMLFVFNFPPNWWIICLFCALSSFGWVLNSRGTLRRDNCQLIGLSLIVLARQAKKNRN